MSTPARFSDGQYKNWLKCSLSLIIMKEALHDYIDNEVKNLHGDIMQNVSSILCASSTGNQCGSCSSKTIRLTGNPGKWFISCKNNICDKWLQQILAVHENPNNSSINWKNADISLWPNDWYQVAKIFMPKGQDKTVKMPDDLDAPAILSLLKYCKWFRKDLPSTQILSDLIDFRNTTLHSGDLKVSNGDKDSKMDLMIQLLKGLKIQGDAISDLEKLKKEDIDINFRETEIRLLQEMVSGLVNDINTVKADMATVQNSMSDLSETMDKMRDRTTETIGKVDAVNTDMEGIRKSLEERQVIYDKMKSFFDKNPDIHEKEITEGIRTIGMDVNDLQSNLTRLETELQEINKRLSFLEEKVEGIDERLAAVEKRVTETTRKKRPETEGLRNLKTQTENKLDTHRMLGCIPTKQAEEAKKLLAEKRSIVIEGNPGEGKTTMSLHLIDNEMFRDKRVVLNKPRQWEKVDTDWVAIVVLEDVFGQYDFDPGRFQEWMIYLPTIQEHVNVGKLQVIVTTRADVLSKAYCQRLGSLNLFSKELSLTLSSKQLTNSEKVSILNRELKRHKRNMKEEEIKECIANFGGGLIGFPQCCSLFAGDSKSFDKGPDFFRSPKEFFVENIEALEPTSFLSLAFLFCNGTILEENLSSETIPECSKKLLMELASSLFLSENQAAITLLRDAYDNFGKMYVVKSMSYDFKLESEVKKPSIMFTHATVSEAVGHVLWKRHCEMVVKYGDSEYLYQKTYAAEVKDSTSEKEFLPVYVYGLMAERIFHDVVNRRHVSSVVKHSALKRPDFIKKLKDELSKGNVLKEFFTAGKDGFQSLSDGKCGTFLQYILKGDEDVVRLVYNEFLEMLACAHNDNIPDCWWCEEKQNLLELAIYYHHFEIADKLIARKASYTYKCLYNAVGHGDLKRVQTIIENLKKNDKWNPEGDDASLALEDAICKQKFDVYELLVENGVSLKMKNLRDVVWKSEIPLKSLEKAVQDLKDTDNWDPKCHDASIALIYAICRQKDDVYDLLVQNRVSLKMKNFLHMIKGYHASLESIIKAIKHLNDTGTWDPKCDDASEALEVAILDKKYDVYDQLVQNGVSLKMKHLPDVLWKSEISLESLKKVILHMKETDNWNPKCDDASKALEAVVCLERDDVVKLLQQEEFLLYEEWIS